MAAKKKDEVPKHITEYFKKSDKVDMLLESTKIAHSQAYNAALEAILDEKTGLYDHKKLEDTKVQDKFIDKMVDSYLSFAVKRLGMKEKPKDELEQDIILQRYLGITKTDLKRSIRKAKSNYSIEVHEATRKKLIERQEKELQPLTYSHMDKSHIGDILKHTGVSKYINKDNLNDVAEVVQFLDAYKEKGEINLSDLKPLPDHMLTDSAKKGIKKFKSKYKEAA